MVLGLPLSRSAVLRLCSAFLFLPSTGGLSLSASPRLAPPPSSAGREGGLAFFSWAAGSFSPWGSDRRPARSARPLVGGLTSVPLDGGETAGGGIGGGPAGLFGDKVGRMSRSRGARARMTGDGVGEQLTLNELEDATEVLFPAKKKRSVASAKAAAGGGEDGGKPPPMKRAKKEDDGAGDGASGKKGKGGGGKGAKAKAGNKEAGGGQSEEDDGSNVYMAQDAKGNAVERAKGKEPKGWREIYDLVLELRKERDAPVDWAGSESLGTNVETGEVNEYHTLIALMLSSQTKDQVVAEAVQNLKDSPGGLTPESVLAMSDEELKERIFKVGFHNNKTKFLKQAAQILLDKHGGKVPKTAKELTALPGIGPKMAYIILKVAYNVVDGIGVDTHMHRIFNILGWVTSKQPEQTRVQLESWLPREEWDVVNVLFVGLGQMTQQPVHRAQLMRRCIDSSQPEAALKLVNRLGADTSSADPETGETPLMYAARQGNVAAVGVLLKPTMRLKKEAVNTEGSTAYDIAVKAKNKEIADLIGPPK